LPPEASSSDGVEARNKKADEKNGKIRNILEHLHPRWSKTHF
jgi:hypothetical protein